jgi:two-component sensor histidine kinase
VLFPATLLATLAGGPASGWIAATTSLAASEILFGRAPLLDLRNVLSVGTAALSLALLVWLAARYRQMILARGREREDWIRKQYQLFERSHGFMCVLAGPELRYEFANRAYLDLVRAQDVIGKRLVEVMPELDPQYLDIFATVRRTGQAFVGHDMAYHLKPGGKQMIYVDAIAEPIFADDGAVQAVFIEGYEVTDKVEAERQLTFVTREVDHRANNLLAVIQSIVRLSRATSQEELQRNLIGRIDALARAHQLLASARWLGADLRRLVEEELLPYTLGEPDRTRLAGPELALSPNEAQALAMGLHELATNAAKYGALSTSTGKIRVTWRRESSGARRLRWQEDGGPRVAPPTHKSFGTSVLDLTLRGVGGRTRLLWRPEGLICEFELPPEPPSGQPQIPPNPG